MEGEALHVSPKPSCGKSPHCSGGFCGGTTISCSSAQLADRPLRQQCVGCTTTSLHNVRACHPATIEDQRNGNLQHALHMALPVDAIFNAIDELIELAEYALMPMSSTQAVSLAYMVFSKNPILLQDLRAWNHTWENMKVHLREHKKTCHLFLLQHRSTPKQILLCLVAWAPTSHPIMITNLPT